VTIQEAVNNIEKSLIYWYARPSGEVDKNALELLLAYTKEALKTSHNSQSDAIAAFINKLKSHTFNSCRDGEFIINTIEEMRQLSHI
jgi:transposase